MSLPQVSILPRLTTINPTCRACNASPALMPDECQLAERCRVEGPLGREARRVVTAKRADGSGVRKVIRYEEEGG